MKRKLLAVLITTMFAASGAYAQGTTAPKDTGMTKDRPAATKSDTTVRSDTTVKSKDGSPDAMITSKIKTGFVKDKIVRSRNYNVDTSGGVVTVKGKARTQAEADRAIEIAKSTQGVSSVKNEIQVIPDKVATDKPKSTTKAKTTAAGDPTPRNSTPPSEQPKDGTASTSTKAGGSTSASKEGGSPDALITTKIKAEHAKDKDVSATKISVDTTNGVVTLGGTAKSKAEADKAVMLAKNVKDVKSVKNNIKIEAMAK
jgi:osmotically-inducible protein OsmY